MAVSLTKDLEATLSSSLWWLHSNIKVKEKANTPNSVQVSPVLPHSVFVSQAGSITLLPLMVQQLLNLFLGESCYRSELEKPGLYVMLMVGWWEMLSAAPVQDVVTGGFRGKSWGRTAPSWGSQGLKLSWSPVDIPCLWGSAGWLLSLWHLWKWIEIGRWCDIPGKLLCWVTKLLENLESTHPLDILSFSRDPYKEMKVSLFRLLRSGRG